MDIYWNDTITVPELRVATTEISLNIGGKFFSGTGASRCSGPDKFDPQLAELFAESRALREIARKAERRAYDIVKERERLRLQQEEAIKADIKARKQKSKRIKKELGIK